MSISLLVVVIFYCKLFRSERKVNLSKSVCVLILIRLSKVLSARFDQEEMITIASELLGTPSLS